VLPWRGGAFDEPLVSRGTAPLEPLEVLDPPLPLPLPLLPLLLELPALLDP
jgi:hypothetical protein